MPYGNFQAEVSSMGLEVVQYCMSLDLQSILEMDHMANIPITLMQAVRPDIMRPVFFKSRIIFEDYLRSWEGVVRKNII